MKKITLSIMTIAAVAVIAFGATSAYLKDTKAIKGNTFSTGSVLIGDVTGIHFYVDNLTPGKWTSAYDVYLPYRGSVPADLYVGVDGTSSPGDAAYFGDKLYVRIYSYEAGNVVWQGWSNELATAWKKIASNTSWGDKRFAIDFYLDENFERQNVTNTDTEFYIYAVQTGGPVPVTVPYLTVVP